MSAGPELLTKMTPAEVERRQMWGAAVRVLWRAETEVLDVAEHYVMAGVVRPDSDLAAAVRRLQDARRRKQEVSR